MSNITKNGSNSFIKNPKSEKKHTQSKYFLLYIGFVSYFCNKFISF